MSQKRTEVFGQFDWSATPLGPIEGWSQALKDAVGLSEPDAPFANGGSFQTFLLKLSDALRPVEDPVEVQATTARLLGQCLKSTRAYYVEYDTRRCEATVARDYAAGDAPSLVGVYTYEQFRTVIERIADGRTWVVADVTVDRELPEPERVLLAGHGVMSWVDVPLIKHGRLVAILCVVQAKARTWTEDEVRLVEEAAERTWASVERARAESALRESEARTRGLLTASSQVLYRHNADWSRMEELTGGGFLADTVSPDANWLDAYIHPDDQPHVRAAIDKAIATKGIFELEHRVVRADGTLGWTLSRSIPILDERGEIVEWFGAASDVTERREAEEALRRTAETFDRLIFNSPFGIYVIDGDFRVGHASRSALATFGIPNVIGMDLAEALRHIWPEPFASEAIAKFRHTLETGEPFVSDNTVEPRNDRPVVEAYDWRLERLVMPDGRHGVVCYYYDLTDRLHMEEAMRQSEERLRMASSVAHLATWDWDLRSGAVTWSDEHYAMQGYRKDEVAPSYEAWLARLHPEDRDETEAALSQARDGGTRYDHSFRVRHPDGTVRWLSAEGQFYYDDARRPTRMIGVMRDITDERERVAALSESEARFRQFAENSSDTIWIIDAKTGRFEFLSPAFEGMWGAAREDVLSGAARWEDFVHPEDRDAMHQVVQRSLAGETCMQTYRIVRPDTREVRWIFDTGFPVADETGRIVRAGGIAQDLTDRIRGEQAVRDSRRMFATLLEGIPQLVWRAVNGGRWIWAGRQWTDYSGQSEEESRSYGWLDVVHPDDRALARQAWQGADAGGGIDVKLRLRAKTGVYRWFQTRSLAVRDEDGKVVEWLGTCTDIDDLQRMQQQQEVMVAELQHRTRNLLGVVRSLSSETLSSSRTLEDFGPRFHDRLNALSRVQGLLSRSESRPIVLRDLVEAELGALGAELGPRVSVEGPYVTLRPRVVQTLALAIHELATNARKYGALAGETGRLQVCWRLTPDRPAARTLGIEWSESGLPRDIGEHSRPGGGYGRKLIERALPYSLGARTSYSIGEEGVICSIELPLDDKE